MTMNRIVPKLDTIPQEIADSPAKAKPETQATDLKALRDSLNTKRELLRLLEKGGYVKDIDIIADVDKAIADLDGIIQAFPDEDFTVTI